MAVTPIAREMDVPTSTGRARTGLEPTLALAEGEMAPVVATIELGQRVKVTLPVGAYTTSEGKPCFVQTTDVVGLTAVTLGIGVGALGLRKLAPIIKALAERIRPH